MITEFVDIQGEPLAVRVYEPTEHRGDALLIHGYTGSKEDFTTFGPALARLGYRVVTFDNRGQHESSHSTREDAYGIPSLARDAIALAEHYGLRSPHLLGHSFGGLVAQRATVMAPGTWASLTIFCSGPGAIPNPVEVRETVERLRTMSLAEVWDRYRDDEARTRGNYDLRKRRWNMSDKRSVLVHANHLINEPSLVAEVRATGVPVHVLYGENDDAWPLEMQDAMAQQLGAPVSVIPNAGHCPNEDAPDLTAAVVTGFWDAH